MVEFIGQNPAFQGAQQVYDLQAQQDQADLSRFTLDEAIRTRDANDAVDSALRDYVQRSYPAGSAPGVAQSGPQGASLAGQQPQAPQPGAAGPGPAATAAQGNAPGFDALMQQVAPRMPQTQQPQAGMPLPGTMSAQPGAHQPVPNATPGMQPQMMPAQGGASLSGQQPMEPPRLNRIDLARTLSQTPGTGAQAIALVEQQEAIEAEEEKARDHAVENFFKSLDAGDVNSAHYWSQKSGMDIPPDALADAELVQHLGIVGKWKQLYGADLTNFGKFTQQYFQAMESGQKVNPYSFFAANPPSSRGAARASTKRADYEFLVSEGLSKQEAMARVWSGGASGGMKYSDALKIASGILETKLEGYGLPPDEKKALRANFDTEVEAMARRFMGGDFTPADEGGDGEEEGYIDEATGREVTSDDGVNWYYADDGSPYVAPE